MVMYLEIDFKSIEQEMYTLIKIMDAEGNVKNGWQEVARFIFFFLSLFWSPHPISRDWIRTDGSFVWASGALLAFLILISTSN